LTWSITVWVITAIVGQPLVLLLLGLGRFQRMAVPVTAFHLSTLAAMAILGARWGGAGVALALAGGLTLGVLPLYVYESSLALRALSRTESTVTPSAARY
jgi:O-antigen/teichoic acid export membrane protein